MFDFYEKEILIYFGLFVFSFFTYALEDIDYEKQIHRIYLRHYKDPVTHSDWSKKIRSLPQNYQLKFKDNLWDLSGIFFKDSLYWSKLWVANPEVENPHRIYRGNFIKFDPQTLASVNTSKYSVNIQAQFPGLIVPENEWTKGALSQDEIPSSFPELNFLYPDEPEMDLSQLRDVVLDRQVIVPFFLNDEPLSPSGEIISKDDYGEVINLEGERLVVRIDSDVAIGDMFTVFADRGRIGNIFQFLTLNEREIMIQGLIKILSYISGSDSLYLATIVESIQSISPGDSLLKGEPLMYDFSQKGELGSATGFIIGNSL